MNFKPIIIASLLFFMSGCEASDENTSKKYSGEIKNVTQKMESKSQESLEAPIELTQIDGKKLKLQKFDKGIKVEDNDEAILFNFFATWCPPCKAEIPHLNNLQDKFKGKLKIVSVLMEDKNKEQIEAFIKQYKIKFDVTYGESNFTFAKSLGGVIGIPYMVLYKPDGSYATHYVGLVPEEMLESDISKVIN